MANGYGIPLPQFPPKEEGKFWSKIDRRSDSECWLWQGNRYHNGYGQHIACGRTMRAHRIAFLLGHGIDPAPFLVCHTCDQRLCCNPKHLWLGTAVQNSRDAVAKGRMAHGDDHYLRRYPELRHGRRNGAAKLTEADVIEIRRLYATGDWLQREIGAKFGLRAGYVCLIVNRKLWAHVK